MTKKVFITGGAGFIGSHICRKLIEKGDEPIVYDAFLNFVDPFKTEYSRVLNWRFKGIKDKITWIRGDIRDKEHLRKSIKKTNPQHIIHLAALPIATKSRELPEETVSINLLGTTNVLEAIRGMDIERFIYTSSSFVYGDFKYSPCDEKHPCNPQTTYGGTKYTGEILTKAYAREFGVKYTIIRPSAVYGFSDINQRVSGIFVERAFSGKPIYIEDEGKQKLDFTYVKDVADGFILAMNSKKARNNTFNLTRGEGRPIKELYGIINSIIPFKKVEYRESDIVRPKRGALDITKARQLLNYQPKYSLEEGIGEYIRTSISQI